MATNSAAVTAANAIIEGMNQPKVPVEHYLVVGQFLKALRDRYPSTKLMGLFLKENHPEIAQIDAAVRSNCVRLVEALEGTRDIDLLEVLKVKDIRDYHTSHPSVIIRHYLKLKRKTH